MSEICPICGLPKDVCVCEEVAKEQSSLESVNEDMEKK